ncbi:alpha/beta fold hydrolase [Clostridium beijerinckii]|uniref:alpha/beta fold hydrolase n=1 Tax=Clostridium beijerinckii TaxID=1520 RepID=UPI00098CA70E|nr:alpha/beta hydrolase [Clostridium beijerinckii]MBA8934208.1 pimeloyl-ACP methyl ester carboxylesterase [Clostridium beijerinckii]NRU38402.1 pimeloyl-ACP methyl ester carboxylesterase [Clostridium beijerinckii]NSA98320.1 pimeloyl-ACP methyl ester carboxylesterase [Clostridium beijerinckii]OOM59050.1 putative aminoacrylate hydrolase RutD [Clostridium beijerinckii]OOM67332.1 putative aminoacrylate hydrolase RutD [Clostridium beijerinckii]
MYLSRKEKKERLKTKNKKKFIKYVYLSFISVAFILFIGFVYERIGEYTDAKRYPPVGEMVDVNNHKINVFSKGEGDKTVIFCSGHEAPSSYADFYPLYNEISNYAKVVTYDRPGHGWSEVTDKSRDIDSIVEEMHDALKESGQKAPYILVGHSFASLEVIRFAQIYKNEVSGIVLIDGGNPQYYADTGLEIPKSTEYAFKVLKSIGIARLIVNNTDYFSKNFNLYPDDLKQLYLSMILKTMYNKNIIDEGNQGKTSAETVLENGYLGDMPIKILTDPYDSAWNNTQAELKDWSTNSEQIIVDGAGHAIHHTHPDIINNEILELIKSKI